jgi:hypothetical protein
VPGVRSDVPAVLGRIPGIPFLMYLQYTKEDEQMLSVQKKEPQINR